MKVLQQHIKVISKLFLKGLMAILPLAVTVYVLYWLGHLYLPMSYQLGGFTVMIPTAQIEPVDLSVEEAMRFCLTAAVSIGKPEFTNAGETEHKKE